MIDFIKIRLNIIPSELVNQRVNSPLHIMGGIFEPVIRNGYVSHYNSKLGNLFLSIREDELIIQNSLTKYYHGNNFANLTYTQLQEAICVIENSLGLPIRNARIINFEFGVVIEDNNIPWTLSRMGHYKGKPPMPMHSKGLIYGTFWENTTHKLKLYDKTSEIKRREGIKLDKKLLRVEKYYTRSHFQSLICLKGNPINTLEDLASRKTLEILSEDLITSLSQIELMPIPEGIEKMSSMNLRRWCYLQDSYFRNIMKKFHPKAFKIDRKEINRIIQDYRENGQNCMIDEVKNKLSFCLEN